MHHSHHTKAPRVKYETPENKSIPHLLQNWFMFHREIHKMAQGYLHVTLLQSSPVTSITLPLRSAQVPLTHGAPWEDHAEQEVQSIDAYDGKQVVPQLGESGTARSQTQTNASCALLTTSTMIQPHCLPSLFDKKGTHQNKSKQITSATSELKLSSWIWDHLSI